MKRIISISCVAAAALCLLALTVLPHHHHDGSVCFAVESRVHDHDACDEHHHHGDGAQDGEHSRHTCAGESEYTLPGSDGGVKCRVLCCEDHNHVHLFPIYFIAAGLPAAGAENPPLETDYGDHAVFYQSAEPGPNHGLRAPPVRLS